jgi:hypothetical protein
MPEDSMPRTLAILMVKSPGSLAPGSAHGTLRPTATLGAPNDGGRRTAAGIDLTNIQTISVGVLDHFQDMRNNDAVEGRRNRIKRLDSRPAMVSRWESSSLVSLGSTRLRSQDSENFMDESRKGYQAN